MSGKKRKDDRGKDEGKGEKKEKRRSAKEAKGEAQRRRKKGEAAPMDHRPLATSPARKLPRAGELLTPPQSSRGLQLAGSSTGSHEDGESSTLHNRRLAVAAAAPVTPLVGDSDPADDNAPTELQSRDAESTEQAYPSRKRARTDDSSQRTVEDSKSSRRLRAVRGKLKEAKGEIAKLLDEVSEKNGRLAELREQSDAMQQTIVDLRERSQSVEHEKQVQKAQADQWKQEYEKVLEQVRQDREQALARQKHKNNYNVARLVFAGVYNMSFAAASLTDNVAYIAPLVGGVFMFGYDIVENFSDRRTVRQLERQPALDDIPERP